jgi:hypothetical protein
MRSGKMAYQPKRKTVSGSYGPSGAAKVMIHPSGTKVKVALKDKQGVVSEYILDRENCPKNLSNGIWFVSLTLDKSKMMNLRPWNGIFKVITQKFAASKDKPPTPKEDDKYGLWFFTVILEVVEGNEKGMEIPLRLNYWFTSMDEDGKVAVGYEYHPKSKYMPMLIDYCDLSGVWEKGPMPYKDNVLPMMEKRILAAAKTFQVSIKEGYVQSILGGGSVSEDDFTPDVEE